MQTLQTPDLREVQKVFFDAMAAGIEETPPKTYKCDMLPGMLYTPFVQGDFRVVCERLTTPYSDRMDTTTTIFYQGHAAWRMHACGLYEKGSLPFLRLALRRAHVEQRHFYGGRGPTIVADQELEYINSIRINAFTGFSGSEQIVQKTRWESGHICGYAWYRGYALFGEKIENSVKTGLVGWP